MTVVPAGGAAFCSMPGEREGAAPAEHTPTTPCSAEPDGASCSPGPCLPRCHPRWAHSVLLMGIYRSHLLNECGSDYQLFLTFQKELCFCVKKQDENCDAFVSGELSNSKA